VFQKTHNWWLRFWGVVEGGGWEVFLNKQKKKQNSSRGLPAIASFILSITWR